MSDVISIIDQSPTLAVTDSAPRINVLNGGTIDATMTDAEVLAAWESETGRTVATDAAKLDGIEANATADQTGAEIKAAYEAEADTNAFTDAEKTKLAGIEAGADVTDAANVNAVESDPIVGAVNGIVKANGAGTISAAIEDTDYQSVLAEGAFVDGDKTKLDGIESGATADQSNAEIETAYNAQVAAASQAEAEAGTESAIRRFSPLRIAQAIAAFMGLSGAGAPSSTPKFINQPYYDTTNGDWYVAKGTSSSADWVFKLGRTYSSGAVAGGPVTTVSTGTFPAIIDGAEYEFGYSGIAAGASAVRIYINGDTTESNYREGVIRSSGTTANTSNAPTISVNAIGDSVVAFGRIRIVDGEVWFSMVHSRKVSGSYHQSGGGWHVSATSVTEIQATSLTANHIADGSEIWIRRVK